MGCMSTLWGTMKKTKNWGANKGRMRQARQLFLLTMINLYWISNSKKHHSALIGEQIRSSSNKLPAISCFALTQVLLSQPVKTFFKPAFIKTWLISCITTAKLRTLNSLVYFSAGISTFRHKSTVSLSDEHEGGGKYFCAVAIGPWDFTDCTINISAYFTCVPVHLLYGRM